LKKEKCPDGSKDENVFDIRQGTAIALFIKTKSENSKKVFHSELWGMRKDKYDQLINNDITTTKWHEIAPKSEFYLFVPRDEKLLELYEKSLKITEIFPLNGVGMTTARDHFVIDTDKNRLINRIRLFKHSKYSDDELHEFFQIRKKKGWDIRKAWKMLQNVSDSDLSSLALRVLYRPFDVRWILYHDSVVWRTVKRVMRHMMQENLGLITRRQMLPTHPCNYVFVSNHLISDGVIRSDNKGGESLFPHIFRFI
jgi:predicted helicase